jgi:hypothetical protein
MKQVADAAVAELGLSAVGTLRARLQAVADELDITTGWSSIQPEGRDDTHTAVALQQLGGGGQSDEHCAGGCQDNDDSCSKWLKPWAHFGIDCPVASEHLGHMVAQHGADRVRHALEEMWDVIQRRRESNCSKPCSKAACLIKFMTTLKDTLSSSLQPAGQGSCKFRDCMMSCQIWGDQTPSDEDTAIMKHLVHEMNFVRNAPTPTPNWLSPVCVVWQLCASSHLLVCLCV